MALSAQPAVSVSLPELIGLNAYTKLVIPLVADRLGAWEQSKAISPQEKRTIDEILASRGSRALHERTFKIHPYGRTSRNGGHILLTHFLLTEKHVLRYHIKIHADKKELDESERITQFLQERFGDVVLAPRYTDRRTRLAAYDVSPGQTLDEVLEQEKKPERKEELLTQTMQTYFSIAQPIDQQTPRSPSGLVNPLERHSVFLSDHFLRRYDKRMRRTSTHALLKEFEEMGEYLDPLPKVFCLNDLHGGNVLIEGEHQRLIDLSAKLTHLSHGLVKILSHPSISVDLETKLLGKAKELARDFPGHAELERSYYLSQIVDDILATQRYLERAQTDDEEKENWKQQALVAYNFVLRRIDTARKNKHLEGKLDEKLRTFTHEQGVDVHYIADDDLNRLKEHYHRPYGSVAIAMQEAKSSGQTSERAIRWGIRKPVWMRRLLWGGITTLGLGLIGFGGYQVYERAQERKHMQQEIEFKATVEAQEKIKIDRNQQNTERYYEVDFCTSYQKLLDLDRMNGVPKNDYDYSVLDPLHRIDLLKDENLIIATAQKNHIPVPLLKSMYSTNNVFCNNARYYSTQHLNLLDPRIRELSHLDPQRNLEEGTQRLSSLFDKYHVDRDALYQFMQKGFAHNPDEYPLGVKSAVVEFYGYPYGTYLSYGGPNEVWGQTQNTWFGPNLKGPPKPLLEIVYNTLHGGPESDIGGTYLVPVPEPFTIKESVQSQGVTQHAY